MNKTNPFLST